MKNYKKGAVLISVVIVVIVLALIMTGIRVASQWTIDTVADIKTRTDFFFAAEAGANTALKWKINGSHGNLSDLSFNHNGFKVDLKQIKIAGGNVIMESKATKNGRSCTIKMEGSGSKIGPTKFGIGVTGKAYDRVELEDGDEIFGESYFKHVLQFAGYPVFHGMVNSSSEAISLRTLGDVGSYQSNYDALMAAGGLANFFGINNPFKNTTTKNLEGSIYHLGIWEKTIAKLFHNGTEQHNANETKEETLARYLEIFPEGYNCDTPPETVPTDPQEITYSWNDFITNSAGSSKPMLAMQGINRKKNQFKDVNLVVTGNKATLTYKYIEYKLIAGVPWYKRKGVITWGAGLDPKADWHDTTETINLNQVNTVLIPEFQPFINTVGNFNREHANNMVKIKGKLSESFTLVTEANNVGLAGDLYYKGLEEYANMSAYDYSINPNATDSHGDPLVQVNPEVIQEIKNKVNEKDIYCSIIAGLGTDKSANIGPIGGTSLDKLNEGDNVGSRQNSMLVTAVLYSPRGHFGPLALDNSLYTYYPLYWVSGHTNKDKITKYRLINVGSILANKLTDFRLLDGVNKKGGVWRHLGTVGIVPAISSDTRLENGKVPFGFIDFSETDDSLGDDVIWTVEYN